MSSMQITEPIKTHVRSVDKELAEMWRSAAQGQVAGMTAPLTRTVLLNIVVLVTTEAEASDAGSMLSELASVYPARAIVVDTQPAEPGHELDAEVSMFCSLGERGRRLCGEEIRLHAHGVNSTALGAIMPVLAADLPVYLLTPGDLQTQGHLLAGLASTADHWIIDSRRFAELGNQYTTAVETADAIALHDLAWTGLSQWRELTAQLFDDISARQYLRGVRSIAVDCAAAEDGSHNVEALMMAAWLMTQLDWREAAFSSQHHVTAVADGQEAEINFICDATATGLNKISLTSQMDGDQATFSVGRVDGSEELRIETDAPGLPLLRRTVPLEELSTTREMCRILDLSGADKLYNACLPRLLHLIKGIDK